VPCAACRQVVSGRRANATGHHAATVRIPASADSESAGKSRDKRGLKYAGPFFEELKSRSWSPAALAGCGETEQIRRSYSSRAIGVVLRPVAQLMNGFGLRRAPTVPEADGVAAYSLATRSLNNPDQTVFVSGFVAADESLNSGEGAAVTDSPERLLAELFTQFAPVRRVSIPRDRITGKILGNYAFVEFFSTEDASYAAKVVDGVRFNGRRLLARGPSVQQLSEK
jgi:hypothetical protein